MNVKHHFHTGLNVTITINILPIPDVKFSVKPFTTKTWWNSISSKDQKEKLPLSGHSHEEKFGIFSHPPLSIGGKLRLVGNKFMLHSHMSVSEKTHLLPPKIEITYKVMLPPPIKDVLSKKISLRKSMR